MSKADDIMSMQRTGHPCLALYYAEQWGTKTNIPEGGIVYRFEDGSEVEFGGDFSGVPPSA